MYNKNANYGSEQGYKHLVVCPVCDGTGRMHREQDNTNISGSSDLKEATCPLCKGRGRIKYLPRFLKIRYGCRTGKILLTIRRPRSGRGGRPSLGRYLLLSPQTPVSGCAEGDMIPDSQIVPGYVHSTADARQQELDDYEYEEDGPSHAVEENILAFSDELTFTLSDEFGTNLTISTDSPEALQPLPNLVGSIRQDQAHYELVKLLWPEDEPALQLPVTEPDPESHVRVTPVGTAEAINQYRANPSIDIEGQAGLDLTLPRDSQLPRASLINVLPPEIPDQQNPLDITGLAGPVEPDIDTNVIGNTW